jgi:hypothetical protein
MPQNKLLPLLLIAGVLCIGVGIYFAFNKGTASTETTRIASSSGETTYSGNDEISLGTLQPGQSGTLTYLSGKIITNTSSGWSSPIWGVAHDKTLAGWLAGLPHKDMWSDAVYVQLGNETTPFREGQNSLVVTNHSSQAQEAKLKMNDSRFFLNGSQKQDKITPNVGDARFSFMVK